MAENVSGTEDRILDLAESLIRKNGYNGFSFRDIAAGIGVKSASVHYHFPTKAALGARVARRYTDRFLDTLGDPDKAPEDANAVIDKVRALFRSAMLEDGRVCLCGVLAAESVGLPDEVAAEAKAFFTRLTDWLSTALSHSTWGKDQPAEAVHTQALRAVALFEGGLLIARIQNDTNLFDLL